jgi:hypothetical protein
LREKATHGKFWVLAAAIIWAVNMLVHGIIRPERQRHSAPLYEST